MLPSKLRDTFAEPRMTKPMPALFVGHGSPMNAIEKTRFAETWERIGQELPKPSAILCISAHWQKEETRATAGKRPETMYDFWGFPEELYRVTYPAPGSPRLVNSLTGMRANVQITPDPVRGFDHGCWIVLVRMFPKANIPVVQLSLNVLLSPRAQYEFAKELSYLRRKGVLIIGSGNIVHNLPMRRAVDAGPYDWALEFDALAKDLIERGDHERLIEYEKLGQAARLSIPTNEHYLPALYVLALQEDHEPVAFFNEGIVYGSISMRGFRIG
jgi:4,5-DOPA dioxygenase extradiol